MTKADKVLWGLAAVILSLFIVVEAKTMMLISARPCMTPIARITDLNLSTALSGLKHLA